MDAKMFWKLILALWRKDKAKAQQLLAAFNTLLQSTTVTAAVAAAKQVVAIMESVIADIEAAFGSGADAAKLESGHAALTVLKAEAVGGPFANLIAEIEAFMQSHPQAAAALEALLAALLGKVSSVTA